MNTKPGSEQGTTFTSMGDDLLEMRFSPENKKAFQNQIDVFESLLTERSYAIPIDFFGRFDIKTRKAIQNLVNEIFKNAEKFDLKLQNTDPEVHFFTLTSWEARNGKIARKQINLPAAKISWNDGTPFVQLIIPEKITTGEEVIKTVRLLFSKLFGKLYFDEHVPKKTPYRLLVDENEAVSFDFLEKAHFCRLLERFPNSMLVEFDKIAKLLHIKGPKSRELGKKEFFRNLIRNEEKPNEEYAGLLETLFQQHIDTLRQDSDVFFDELTAQIFNLIPQSNLLLPHDQNNFRFLRDRRQWTLFHALDERLQFTVNSIRELQDCREFLESVTPKKPIDYQTANLWQKTLNERTIQLAKKGLVKPFLIEGAKLTEKQKKELDQFPLWIWRQRLFENYPKGIKPEKMIAKITNQFKYSIYHKLFEVSFRLIKCLKKLMEDDKTVFAQSDDFPKIKALFAWLEIRQETLTDLLVSCKVGNQLGGIANKKKLGKDEILKNFEQGWSYFVSFAMVHQYYLETKKVKGPKDKRSEQFFRLIDRYIQNRIGKQPSFQISGLLLHIYKLCEFDLPKIIKLIQEDAQPLDFFILNQPDIFRHPSNPPLKTIEHYSESVQQWQIQRESQKIQKEELDRIRT
ncbi:MAG: hypothetical protein GY866_27205 [Proteobacteria bacterium]|nr:hypothetical protein [Pseudomonadota bacterium]